MRAGIFLAYWPWFSPEEQIELAVLADGLGLDSVWISEAWGQDAVSVLGLLAGRTERIGLGSGLFQIPALPIAHDPKGGETAFDIHHLLGNVMVYLIGLHILGALKHTFIDRDGDLFRMLPFGTPRA